MKTSLVAAFLTESGLITHLWRETSPVYQVASNLKYPR